MASIKWNVLMPDNCQPSERLCNCRFHCSISLRGCATHGVGAHMAKRCHGCHFWTILIYARIAPSSSKVWVTLLLHLWEKYSYYIHTRHIFTQNILFCLAITYSTACNANSPKIALLLQNSKQAHFHLYYSAVSICSMVESNYILFSNSIF